VQRQAHHLGRRLGDDGVAAGTDVGHVGLDRDDAAIVEPHARRRFHDEVVAERGGHAHADQPAALAGLAGQRIALVPAETISAGAQAVDEAALRETVARVFGIDLRVLRTRRSMDRAQALRHLVDGDLQRHHAGASPGARMAFAFREVEHREPGRRQAVCPRHRAAESGRTAVSGLPPGRSRTSLHGRWR